MNAPSTVATLCCLALACAAACGADGPNKAAGAAITAGAAIAVAGIHRAATGGCWADCRPGMRCDESSGTCVAVPCGGSCRTGERCLPVEGHERCVPRLESDPAAPGEAQAPLGADAGVDPCQGLCMRGETCVVNDGGVADCVAAK